MTPFEFGILLHYYCRAEDHEALSLGQPILRETMGRLIVDLGLLAHDSPHEGCTYQLTEKGRAFIDFALATPMPVQRWALPEVAT